MPQSSQERGDAAGRNRKHLEMDEAERASRALRGRIGAHRLHATHDPRETTKAARLAFWSSFEREVDPDGLLEPEERARRAATPEPPTSLASPICALGHEQRDSPSARLIGGSTERMRPTSSDSTATYRLATQRPSGLQHACRRRPPPAAGIWRGMLHRTVVGRCRPTTGQCRDFTLNRSADWTQLT